MFGLRQKLMFGFGGLLAILFVVSGLGVGVLVQYRGALDKFFYENWRSVEYSQNMVDALDRLNDIAKPISGIDGRPSAADITAAASAAGSPLRQFDDNVKAEDNNITLAGEGQIASDLTSLWKGMLSPAPHPPTTVMPI